MVSGSASVIVSVLVSVIVSAGAGLSDFSSATGDVSFAFSEVANFVVASVEVVADVLLIEVVDADVDVVVSEVLVVVSEVTVVVIVLVSSSGAFAA